MFKIFSETHKVIASNIQKNIYDIYGIELNKESIKWGAIAPDILPQYKFKRHYKEESLNYVVGEIVKLIYISRYLELNLDTDPIKNKIISQKIGIISHYLSDFVCLPHAERWTFPNNMFKHMNYESKLNDYCMQHEFKKNVISIEDIDIFQDKIIRLKPIIKEYIENVIDEYSFKVGFEYDLNFALSLNLKITCFVIDIVAVYTKDIYRDLVFEF